jgi:predicted metalloendopeptidase
LTLGENLADINGLNVAYRAFRKASGASNVSKPAAKVDDDPPPNKILARELTNNKLFFVAYAQTYCMLAHRSALEVWMKTDPHTPGRFRVQGAVSQNEDFAKAFQCKVGSKYNPEKRCNLWV